MSERYRPYRQQFETGFWIEGNAFYWEMVFWDQWLRPHAGAARRSSVLAHAPLRAHPLLAELPSGTHDPGTGGRPAGKRSGHERDNAVAEVRRSVNGSYDPLYQCAYMLGALQFRALHHELVDSKTMTDRQYHDAILRENMMPVAMLRAILTNQKLTPDFKSTWRFLDEVPAAAPGH